MTVVLSGCAPATDTIISGRFGPGNPIVLDNLTITDGRYDVRYSLSAFIASRGAPVNATCAVVDTGGRIAFFSSTARVMASGEWSKIEAEGTFDLPELTLGLRCFPDRDATIDFVVREVTLEATPLD